jgi:hypothetical protein
MLLNNNLHVVIRSCDRGSIQSKRIVNKTECTLRCVNSILRNLRDIDNADVYIIDDRSSDHLREGLSDICEAHKQYYQTPSKINFLGERNTEGQNPHVQSRYSVKLAYDYIYTLPDEDYVYIMDDDQLHCDDAVTKMISAWEYLKSISPEHDIGIFPQCFVQLFPFKQNYFAHAYVRPCHVVPTPVGFYRTTWYTQETFMLKAKVFKKYKDIFDKLQTTGSDPAIWEGNTISDIWQRDDFMMFMPLHPDLMHMSIAQDKPFYWSKEFVINLWETNKTPWSIPENSYLNLNEVIF